MLETLTDNVKLLNTGLAFEYLAIAAYEVAISSGLLNEPVVKLARTFQSQHRDHATRISQIIMQMGGEPEKQKSQSEYIKLLPTEKLINQESIIRYAANLEKLAAISFLKDVAELDDRKIAQTMASISGDEAMHWAVLRQAIGLSPVPVSFIPLSSNEVED